MSVKNLWSANGPDYSTAQKDSSKIVLWGKVSTSIKFTRSEERLIFTKKKKNCLAISKGHSQLWDRADLDTTLVSLKRVYLNPKSNERVGCI